jgi:hypothetical protein
MQNKIGPDGAATPVTPPAAIKISSTPNFGQFRVSSQPTQVIDQSFLPHFCLVLFSVEYDTFPTPFSETAWHRITL